MTNPLMDRERDKEMNRDQRPDLYPVKKTPAMVPAAEVAKLVEALEYCARPFEQRHLVKRELIGEASKRMMTAKLALEEYRKATK